VLVTGEGGMFVTDDEGLYRRALSAYDHGKDPDRVFWVRDVGWKYKFSNVQAAIGLAQLERVDELIEMKRRLYSWYMEELEGTPGITLSHEAPWARSIYWMTSILVDEDAGISRDGLRAALKARNVDTRPVFPAISQYPIWHQRQTPQPNSLRIGNQGINLPSGVCLRREQVAYVCRSLKEILAEARGRERVAA
jgi:perosamine synthetase